MAAPHLAAHRLLPRTPLLFLIADTGGGHRSAALAVSQALEAAYPGRFRIALCDPLGGPGVPAPLRWVVKLYGPGIRIAPWIWGGIWHAFDSSAGLAFLCRCVYPLSARAVAPAVAAHRPTVIVSFHPLTAGAAISARRPGEPSAPVVTVITDLVTVHPAWRHAAVDQIATPSAAAHRQLGPIAPGRCTETGLPVTAQFTGNPLPYPERNALRRSLGLREGGFLVVLTGGAEGSGRIYAAAAAILRRQPGVDVAVICGRNRRLERRLAALARRTGGGRLTVRGFVGNMADWLRCADLVVSKAGPGTIAEAACCAAPLLLTSHVPGQEKGNIEVVVTAGAGQHAPRTRDLVAAIGRLRDDPAAVAAMRAAAARLARPRAAADVASLVAALAGSPGRASAGGVQPADRGAVGSAPERLKLVIPGLAEQPVQDILQ